MYSSSNRSDGPSCDCSVDPPSKPLPRWFEDLCAGDIYCVDVCVSSAAVPLLAIRASAWGSSSEMLEILCPTDST